MTDYFYGGVCSQWFPAKFTCKDDVTFNSTEQYMMAMKALSMNDNESYEKVMKSNDPKYIKHLGRKVKNYDDEKKKWNCGFRKLP